MFSDESRFSVTSDSKHQLLWRERRTRYAQKFVNVIGPGKMVCTGIMQNDRTPFHIFQRGSVTSQQYCIVIILDQDRIFKDAVGPDFLLINGNAWAHRSVEQTCFTKNDPSPYKEKAPNGLERGVEQYPPMTPR
ncbi:transposable element Tcb2 transposase [Trichonephila clavipes]|nr:transposable element Tcb2 transposase [Trichonephila clavipes]